MRRYLTTLALSALVVGTVLNIGLWTGATADSAARDQSTRLSIASLGFQAPITDVGLTANNAIDVPSDMQIGHWNGSALPGSPGAIFLDGHVDGIFTQLNQVQVGQTISMKYDGKLFGYQVVHTELVNLATVDMTRALRVFGGKTEGLNIMTCAGKYVASAGTYDQRLVVYAVRII